jgi:hypothetical protein
MIIGQISTNGRRTFPETGFASTSIRHFNRHTTVIAAAQGRKPKRAG